jgi:hypothetical protein
MRICQHGGQTRRHRADRIAKRERQSQKCTRKYKPRIDLDIFGNITLFTRGMAMRFSFWLQVKRVEYRSDE